MTESLIKLETAVTAAEPVKRGALDDVSTADVLSFIAKHLGEAEPEPLAHLAELVAKHGRVTSMNLLRATIDIERRGGLMTLKEPKRKRTVGGVFFHLAKRALEIEAAKERQKERRRLQAERESTGQGKGQAGGAQNEPNAAPLPKSAVTQPKRPRKGEHSHEPEVMVIRRPKKP